MITILFLMGAGICVFLGAFVETVVIDLYPSMYGWNIAAYVLAGIFALWGIVDLFKTVIHKRRRERILREYEVIRMHWQKRIPNKLKVFSDVPVTIPHNSAPKSKPAAKKNVNNKNPAGKPAGQRKQGKR